MIPHRSPVARLVVLVALALPAAAQQTQTGGGGASGAPNPVPIDHYDLVDNVEGSFVHFGYPPVRPLAFEGIVLYAVNNHDSTVQRYTDASGLPSKTYRVPWGPVSIALWNDPDAGGATRLLVVSRGTQAITMLDALTGETLAVIAVRGPSGEVLAEPGDIVVDQAGDRAFVSCSASQAVLELDLGARAVSDVHFVDVVHPLYLALDPEGNLLVSPMLSGNASGGHVADDIHVGSKGILDLDPLTSTVLASGSDGLPDTDLVRIDFGHGGKRDAVARAMGAVCFQARVHPGTGEVWMLSTGARNKELVGEPAHRGVFATNQMSIVTLPAASAGAVTPNRPDDVIDLDRVGLAPEDAIDPTRTCAQPMSFDFDSDGNAVIAGTSTDNVLMIDGEGDLVAEWDLPEGAIPRYLLYHPALDTVFVYCWGTNELLGYSLALATPTLWLSFDLGFDPTPEPVARGREIFYDASRSRDNNLTCATCHVDGRSDHLVWDLGTDTDPKGLFLTQTLAGIERLAPFHWRGERPGLADFNEAFEKLLGGTPLATTAGPEDPNSIPELDEFEAFVLSISSPPNFVQNRKRVIDDTIQPKLMPILGGPSTAQAHGGRARFNLSCMFCHRYPLGTNSDFSSDGEDPPHRTDRKVGPFHELLRRDFDADTAAPGYQAIQVFLDDTDLPPSTFYPLTGSAVASRGLMPGIHSFTNIFSQFSGQERANLAAFITQFDQGIAPAVQRAVKIDAASGAEAIALVTSYLVPQAQTPYETVAGQSVLNCDLVVYGTVDLGAGPRPLAWWYDRTKPFAQRFVPEDSTVAPASRDDLLALAAAGDASLVFLGTPTGMGRRFGIDFDGDGLFNLDEVALGTDPLDPDSDGDGFPDGYDQQHGDPLAIDAGPLETTPPQVVSGSLEVLWENGRVARVVLESSEPAEGALTYTNDVSGHTGAVPLRGFETRRSVILSGLQPSGGGLTSTYTLEVLLVDPSGNDNTSPMEPNGEVFAGVLELQGFGPRGGVRLEDLLLTSVTTSPSGGVDVCASVRVLDRRVATSDDPLAGYRLIAKAFVDGDPSVAIDTGSVPQGVTFTVTLDPFVTAPFVPPSSDFDEPFVVFDPSDGAGYASVCFRIPSATLASEIELVVQAVGLPEVTDYNFKDLRAWSLPDTPLESRSAKHP